MASAAAGGAEECPLLSRQEPWQPSPGPKAPPPWQAQQQGEQQAHQRCLRQPRGRRHALSTRQCCKRWGHFQRQDVPPGQGHQGSPEASASCLAGGARSGEWPALSTERCASEDPRIYAPTQA
eukprot:3170450-Alexandrium_andersonii.AAC.1